MAVLMVAMVANEAVSVLCECHIVTVGGNGWSLPIQKAPCAGVRARLDTQILICSKQGWD